MRVVFFGSPEWAVPSLQSLRRSSHDVVGVVTAPDRPGKRSRRPLPTAVKEAAMREGIPLLSQPASLRGSDVRRTILDARPDVLCVVAFGRIVPGRLLDAPTFGAVNLHFSLLPRHRGASPVQHAILMGDEETGVTTMQMDRGLDTGPVLASRRVAVPPRSDSPALGSSLAEIGSELLVETLDALARGDVAPRLQDDARATLAPPLSKRMGSVDGTETAVELDRRIRAFRPWPPVVVRGPRGRLRLAEAEALQEVREEAPVGQLLELDGESVIVACANGSLLRVDRVRPDGAKEMTPRAALNGGYLREGARLASCDTAGS